MADAKNLKDMDDDELMEEIKNVVGIDKIAKIGKSKVVKKEIAKKTGKKQSLWLIKIKRKRRSLRKN